MNYAKRKDENQNEIIDEFKSAMPDASVADLSGSGKGIPDVVIGWRGRNYFFEIKNPNKPKSDQQLTDAQVAFHSNWQGQVFTARSASEMIAEIARIHAPFEKQFSGRIE